MEWLHLAGDIGASIAILVCLYFIWDLRKEVETLRDRISGGSLPELDTLEGGEEMPQVEGIASRGGSQVARISRSASKVRSSLELRLISPGSGS